MIAHFEGTENASTLTCNVTNDAGFMTSTEWFLQDFRGSSALQVITNDFVTEIFSVGGDLRPNDPTRTFRNRLTFVNFTAELDRVTVYCGTASSRQQGNFNLRIYSKFIQHLPVLGHVDQRYLLFCQWFHAYYDSKFLALKWILVV